MDNFNEIFKLAAELVNHTERSLFLTGKAGTGKTTFLRHIKDNVSKNAIVAAPTGVAAINAGGVTLHSLFQLPFEPFVPDARVLKPAYGFKMHKNKIDMLNKLELLIIDEVSMLRADTLDAIDASLRHCRRNDLPFGGVQMLYIGDLFQLPPVVKDEEWDLLGRYYRSPFFFHAKAVEKSQPLYVELKKIYRQNEQFFIDILNKIRNDEVEPADLDFLNRLYDPGFRAPEGKRYVVLSTHNRKADVINQAELDRLPGECVVFKATVEENFPESSFPADFELRLKPGAQVMFIKNDGGETRRYYNGKLGVVSKLGDGKIFVELEGSKTEIEVMRETWRNVRYLLREGAGNIVEEELGSFRQFPLRAAWAITIHKSQGLTFERAVIDAGQAFASGQVYVALSRCTTFEGMVLLSKITRTSVKTDPEVTEFAKREKALDEMTSILNVERPKYLRKTLIKSFDWQPAMDLCNALLNLTAEKKHSFRDGEMYATALEMKTGMLDLQVVADKFKDRLGSLLSHAEQTGDVEPLRERVRKAAVYFNDNIRKSVLVPLDEHIAALAKMSKVKQYAAAIGGIRAGFGHFVEQLKNIRYGEIPLTDNLFPEETADENRAEPQKTEPAKKEKPAKNSGRDPGSSHRLSLEMFREGKTIDEIATERNLARSTIEGHLGSFVFSGEMEVGEIVSEKKIAAIVPLVKDLSPASSLSEIKNLLGNDYSYGEIRAVLNHLARTKQGGES